MDYSTIKFLGLDHIGIDAQKSFHSYDPTTNNHTIKIHLIKDDNIHCPTCGCCQNIKLRGSKSQIIKYSSTVEDNINIFLYRRIFKCENCGSYFKERNPFTSENRKISYQKEVKILNALRDINSTFKRVATHFEVSPTFVTNLFDKKVSLNRLTLPDVICVDEVYSKKLSFHSYCFIVYSPQMKRIIEVLDSRKLDSLMDFFCKIPIKERDNVKFFSTDLYDTYRVLAKKCFPKAKICADPFHVIKNISDAFHSLRREIMNYYDYLKHEKNNYYWLLKKYWRLLSLDPSKLNHKRFKVNKQGQFMSQHEILEYIFTIDKRLEIAYDLLHEYRNFNQTATIDNAEEWLDELIQKFIHSGIKQYEKVWKMLKNWRLEIINSFNKVNGFRITNGSMERVNRDVKTMFRLSFGSTNFERMRNRIMFAINKDAPILYNRKNKTNKRKGKLRGPYKQK